MTMQHTRWGALVGVGLLLLVSRLALAGPFPVPTQPPMGGFGTLHLMTGQSCASTPCETGVWHVTASDSAALWVGVTGTGRVKLQCRRKGFPHDVELADSGSLTDSATVVPLTAACETLIGQITACTSGTCKVWADVNELRGGY